MAVPRSRLHGNRCFIDSACSNMSRMVRRSIARHPLPDILACRMLSALQQCKTGPLLAHYGTAGTIAGPMFQLPPNGETDMATFEVLEEYIESQRQDIEQGGSVILEIRDVDTFERLVVKAEVGPPERPIADGDRLILKNLAENTVSDAWTIRVLEELDPEAVAISPKSAYRKSAPDGA